MGGYIKTLCGIITIASAAIVTLELARRYFTKKRKITLWKPAGKVTELAIYPLRLGVKFDLKKVYCTRHGLRSSVEENFRDGCIVIYEKGTRKLLPEASCFDMITIDYTSIGFVLEAGIWDPIFVLFSSLDVSFTMIVIHKGEVVPARDCGERAAEWISQVLKGRSKQFRLGYYNMDFEKDPILTKSYEKYLQTVKLFTNNGVVMHSDLTNPILLNEDSITGVATTMSTFINPYGFGANIVFQYTTGFPLEEYTWKKVKIGNVEFDCIKPCENCVINTTNSYSNNTTYPIDMRRFMMVMKSALQKYVEFKIKDTPYIGVYLKLSGNEGVINVNDEVFALC